jgi:hypothetical protein
MYDVDTSTWGQNTAFWGSGLVWQTRLHLGLRTPPPRRPRLSTLGTDAHVWGVLRWYIAS